MATNSQRAQELLEKYLPFYLALDSGKRQPSSEAQQRFVDVCRGEQKAVTEHEKTYLAYIDEQHKKYFERQEKKQDQDRERKERLRFESGGSNQECLGSPFLETGAVNKQPNRQDWDLMPGGSIDDQEDFADDQPDWEDIEKGKNEKQEP